MRRISVAVLTLTLVLAGCSDDDDPDADDARLTDAADLADRLATALEEGAVAEPEASPLTDLAYLDEEPATVADDYADVVAGMDGLRPTVDAGDVEEDGGRYTAPLRWSWPVAEGGTTGSTDDAWTYDAEAELVRRDDEWRVVWQRSVVEPSLAADEVLEATTVPARRGDVTGAGGEVLVTERPVVRIGIDRVRVPAGRAARSARELARLVDVDVAPYVRGVRAAGDRAFVEAITYRKREVPRSVLAGIDGIEGALAYADEMALAPTREFAAPLLGRVGPVTAEMVEEQPDRYRVGDVAGISGLQARYDEQLGGTPGRVVEAVAEDDPESRELFRVEAVDGEPLALTLDARLQTEAERVLADVGPASALVALRPSDGAVLAAANGPGTGGLNHATFGQFPPGSTFKIVSALALLRAGLTPDSTVSCPRTLVVDGKEFGNYSDYPASAIGPIPLRTAVAQSCNTAFISERDRVDDDALADAAATLGLGVDHDLGFPAYFGSVERPRTETEAAADLIGQGTVLASPMAMAAVVGSVQHGALVVPRLVEQVDVSDHDHTPLTDQEADRLRAMLRRVVTEGSGSGLADVPGPPVIAKTGTAEFAGERGIDTHAWMVAAQGDLAVAAFVEVGVSGSQTAGPLVEAFLRTAR